MLNNLNITKGLIAGLLGLFAATVEATEEAIINSLFMAETVNSRYGKMESLPVNKTIKILKKYKALYWNEKLYPWKK